MAFRTLASQLFGLTFWPLAACCNTDPRRSEPDPAAQISSAPAERPARCTPLGTEHVLGPASATAEADLDKVLPFATEIGDGAGNASGFAVGALRQQSGGTNAVAVLVDVQGKAWRTVDLGQSHGDAEPPRVFAGDGILGAAMLQPSGASRSLQLARIDGDSIHWGAEFLQGLDGSLAYDVVVGAERGVAVWDGVPKDRDVGGVYVATFDRKTLGAPSMARVVTLPGTDADAPRVVPRPGGFWLLWVARRAAAADNEARYRAEDIAFRWLEAVPLDAQAALAGSPRRIGTNDGHVLAYDVVSGEGGAAVVVWRDDDTPSGSQGGQLYRARLHLGGIDGPDVIGGEHLGAGAPNVMQGWLSIADALGPTRLAPLGSAGELLDQLASEATLGAGEPVANLGDKLLVSRPSGLAVRLFVVSCIRGVLEAGTDGGADDSSE
ncbi:MAG: hypothetical protein MUF54_03910 [Polyangiaceae bacterium]|jgi:hypothetical protein|nr:hypothetical protein [Polyangiaceae bacterium]